MAAPVVSVLFSHREKCKCLGLGSRGWGGRGVAVLHGHFIVQRVSGITTGSDNCLSP